MACFPWLRNLKLGLGRSRSEQSGRTPRKQQRPLTCKLELLRLEDRSVPSVFAVTNSADSGSGSLRQAILDANANVGVKDTINFNIPGAGVHTIQPLSALPTITDAVVIDGYTQPGSSPNTLTSGDNAVLQIELDGTNAGAASGLRITAGQSLVRGLVINRFSGEGVYLFGDLANNNTIEGNFIGTNAAGTADLGNTLSGVFVSGGSNNTIGGTTPAARNLISGQDGWGAVTICGADICGMVDTTGNGSNNVVQGNYIGTDVTGTLNLGNSQRGISIDTSSNNIIGGIGPGEANIIAHSGTNGVELFITDAATPTAGNVIRGNSIFDSGNLGIDLDRDGVTTNDPGDGDSGSNNKQNFPVLSAASSFTGHTAIDGTFNSLASATFTIDFYASASADPSGHGEGQTYLGSASVTTNSSGNASISVDLPTTVPLGQLITATATDAGNNTSEFSNSVSVQNAFVVTNTADGPIGSLRKVISNANTNPGTDTISFSIGSGAQTISLASGLPQLTGPVIIDGTTQPGYTGTPLIEINGTSIVAGVNGLTLNGGNSTIKGLKIDHFTGAGVNIASSNNVIGGTGAGAGNNISNNGGAGVNIASGTGNSIQGNTISANSGDGIDIASANNHVGLASDANGNTTGGLGNTISNNGGAGVGVVGAASTGNAILGNSIFGNTGLGIDLGPAGVTANDFQDPDIGPNNLQNFPVLATASVSGANITIQGGMNTALVTTKYRIEFFSNTVADPSGNGEGQTFLTSVVSAPTTNNKGNAFKATFAAPPAGSIITATATDPSGNTSEFSLAPMGTVTTFLSNASKTINATFAPSAPGAALGPVVTQYGYNHFGWLQIVTADPCSLYGGTPVPPGMPFVDPPLSILVSGFTTDGFPYYWNDTTASATFIDLGSHMLPTHALSTATSLTFQDSPTACGSGPLGFATFLVGIYDAIGAGAASPKFDVLNAFTWMDNATGITVTSAFAEFPPDGPGGVFNLQENVFVNDLALDVREVLAHLGAQNVFTPPLITVESAFVNDGSAQRSMVNSLTFLFSEVVSFVGDPRDAFRLTDQAGNVFDVLNVTTLESNGKTVAILTFSGPGILDGSLADGNYTLTIFGAKVLGSYGQPLDGDNNSFSGGDFLFSFHRLFGDVNGDGDDGRFDMRVFMTAFKSKSDDPNYIWYLDYNQDGVINTTDLVQLAHRMGNGHEKVG